MTPAMSSKGSPVRKAIITAGQAFSPVHGNFHAFDLGFQRFRERFKPVPVHGFIAVHPENLLGQDLLEAFRNAHQLLLVDLQVNRHHQLVAQLLVKLIEQFPPPVPPPQPPRGTSDLQSRMPLPLAAPQPWGQKGSAAGGRWSTLECGEWGAGGSAAGGGGAASGGAGRECGGGRGRPAGGGACPLNGALGLAKRDPASFFDLNILLHQRAAASVA